jgi:uncharacterized repeat protein (TIGR01451 family)
MFLRILAAVPRRRAILAVLLVYLSTASYGQSTPFSDRFSANDFGDILLVGNTILTCPAADPDCAAAQAGGDFNNNDFSMIYVDVDGDPSTFASSTATLSLPAGSEILFAGLYWSGSSSSADRAQIRFATPASGGYVDLAGAEIGSDGPSVYAAFVDVTALVQAGGAGDYTVADLQTDEANNSHGGWTMAVAVRIPGEPPRNLVVFDGFQVLAFPGNANVIIDLAGFQTPDTGPVTTSVGLVSAEGDITGPTVSDGLFIVLGIDTFPLSDANNPEGNVFNSTISDLGVTVTAKNPDFVNQLGFDVDRIDASGILPNGATSAELLLFTQSDVYFPFVVTFATELFAPELELVKTMVDQNGGELVVGDVLEVTVTVTNAGQDDAGTVVLTDPIPAHTSFVPGSLEVVSGANAGAKTDAPGDDQAEVSGGDVVFRLGTGADAASGGTLAPAESTEVRFELMVDPATPVGSVILNQATSDYVAVTLGHPLSSDSNEVSLIVTGGVADLAITKTGPDFPIPGGSPVVYTLQVSNNGPSDATDVVVVDTLPASTTFVGADGTGWACVEAAGVVTCDLPSLAVGGAEPITLEVLSPTQTTTLVNEAMVSATEMDPNPDNDLDTEITEVNGPVIEIPTLGDLGLVLLVSALALAAIGVLRRTGG